VYPPLTDKYTWQKFLVWFIGFMGGRLQRMSRARAMRRGVDLGSLAFRVAKKQRWYAERNLRLAQFPHPGTMPAEREALIKRVFIQFSKSVIDFIWMQTRSVTEIEALVDATGLEHVHAALAQGKGAVLITAHMGNWELLGRYLAQHGVPLTVVGRDPENPEFRAMVRRLRENGDVGVVSKGGSVRELLGLLKKNKSIGLLPDQNSGDIFVPFFGVPAGTVAGPATLSLHTGAALIPVYCVRQPDDRYRLQMLPPIDTHSTGDREADQRRIMGDVNQALESVIRQYPDQWLWLHNRWKSAFEEKNRERAWGNSVATEENPTSEYDAALRRWHALNL
jgi:KDO2-lipid IV(A) lauroyltransferase